jgi:inorganic phosphate transporter, PiT family
MDVEILLLSMSCIFGFFMAWGVGANDVANAMGTSVGSKALTLKQAIIIAAIFESAGALLAGSQVTDTLRGKIIDIQLFQAYPDILIFGMLAALLAAGTWLAIATYFCWPVSTTHSIIGAILGFGLVQVGPSAINWVVVAEIAASWVVTPIISGVLAFFLFLSAQKLIFNQKDKVTKAKQFIPFYIFITSFVLAIVTLTKGLKYIELPLTVNHQYVLAVLFSVVMAFIGKLMLKKNSVIPSQKYHYDTKQVESLFAKLMIFTACAMAFAHGSNDVANAIGPIAAVVDLVSMKELSADVHPIPVWILALGAVGIVTGLVTYGYRVIATIGDKITTLTPSRGFAAEIATAATVVISSGIGLPVSTTQTLVGAILGVGFARGIGSLRLAVIGKIFLSWVITLPAGAGLAILFFHLLTWCLA